MLTDNTGGPKLIDQGEPSAIHGFCLPRNAELGTIAAGKERDLCNQTI